MAPLFNGCNGTAGSAWSWRSAKCLRVFCFRSRQTRAPPRLGGLKAADDSIASGATGKTIRLAGRRYRCAEQPRGTNRVGGAVGGCGLRTAKARAGTPAHTARAHCSRVRPLLVAKRARGFDSARCFSFEFQRQTNRRNRNRLLRSRRRRGQTSGSFFGTLFGRALAHNRQGQSGRCREPESTAKDL